MKISAALAIVASLAAVLPAQAQDAKERRGDALAERGALSLTFENDLFGGDDQNYTNGARLSYVTPRGQLPWLGRVARRNLGWLTEAEDWYATYAIGQNIYTPEDISRRSPDPDDRPYAGFLYGSFGLVADSGNRLDTIGVDLGVVGPAAQADDVQRIVHDVVGVQDPKGWDFQLENEPGVRLLYERKYRFGTAVDLGLFDLQADLAPQFGLALGNVDTYASAGTTVRVGRDLGASYGPPRVRPAIAGPGFFEPELGFNWYLFAGGGGRVVGRNIFLEGNSFKDSPSVDPHRVVGDFQAGIALQFRRVEVAYTHVFRTPEFHGQHGFSNFGSVTASLRF